MLELVLVRLSIPVSLAACAWLWRVRGDAIRTAGDSFATPLGTFRYNRESKTLSVAAANGPHRDIALDGPARVIVDPEMDDALAHEALLSVVGVTNFGITDLMGRYRDRYKTMTILLEAGSLRVPLAALRQYRAYDLFDSVAGNSSVRAILSGLRLYRDIDVVAEARAFEIADALRKQGLSVT